MLYCDVDEVGVILCHPGFYWLFGWSFGQLDVVVGVGWYGGVFLILMGVKIFLGTVVYSQAIWETSQAVKTLHVFSPSTLPPSPSQSMINDVKNLQFKIKQFLLELKLMLTLESW